MKSNNKNKWKQILKDCAGKQEYFYLTPISYQFSKQIKFFIEKYQIGTTLDIGAGNSPFQFLCTDKKYISIDISLNKKVDVFSDAQTLPFKNETFDTILCLLVLEHTRNPSGILKEINRVLKNSGTLILAVPHIHYLHDEPNDYYRFTKYGLKYLCEQNGLHIKKITPIGGFFSLCATFISIILLIGTYKNPIMYKPIFFLNKLMIYFISFLDEHTDNNKIFALEYIAVLDKSEDTYEM